MTLRLSNLFEEQMKKIFKRSSSRLDRPARGMRNERRQRRNGGASSSNTHANGGPSTSRHFTRVRRHSSDEDEEVDVVNGETPSTSTGRPMRQIRRQTNHVTNGVSSSHNEPGPSGYRNKRTRLLQSENELSELSSESSESESSNASENYDPNEPKSSRKSVKKKKNRRINGSSAKRPRRIVLHESSDDEQPQEEDETLPISSQNGRRARGRPRKNRIIESEESAQSDAEEEEDQEDDQEEEQEDESEEQEDESDQESYRPAQSGTVRSARRISRRHQSEDSEQPLRPRRNPSKRWTRDDDSHDETNENEEVPTSTRRNTTSFNQVMQNNIFNLYYQ